MTEYKNILKHDKALEFYKESIGILLSSGIPFLVGGTFAVNAYTDMNRPTKDIDFFCKAGDYPKLLNIFSEHGYKTQATDERWIAKVIKDRYFFDIIFGTPNAATTMTDEWFKSNHTVELFGHRLKLIPVTELILLKAFVQERTKYDGADIAHLFLKKHKEIDWKRLLSYMEQYWEILLFHIINFRFIYPSEREKVPRWLLDELVSRLQSQIDLPTQKTKICRGRLISRNDYLIDTKDWGFEDLIA